MRTAHLREELTTSVGTLDEVCFASALSKAKRWTRNAGESEVRADIVATFYRETMNLAPGQRTFNAGTASTSKGGKQQKATIGLRKLQRDIYAKMLAGKFHTCLGRPAEECQGLAQAYADACRRRNGHG